MVLSFACFFIWFEILPKVTFTFALEDTTFSWILPNVRVILGSTGDAPRVWTKNIGHRNLAFIEIVLTKILKNKSHDRFPVKPEGIIKKWYTPLSISHTRVTLLQSSCFFSKISTSGFTDKKRIWAVMDQILIIDKSSKIKTQIEDFNVILQRKKALRDHSGSNNSKDGKLRQLDFGALWMLPSVVTEQIDYRGQL